MKQSKRYILPLGLLILAAIAVFALMCGSYSLTAGEVLATLFGNGTKAQTVVIMKIRLPRILLAILVGTALSTSGCILQAVTKNPLAEPGMIGINSGAALAVILLIASKNKNYYDVLPMDTVYLMPLVSMIGAFLACILIYVLAYKKGVRPMRLILTGIGVNSGITAIITLYQLSMSKGDYNQALTWISGSLWGSSWTYVNMAAILIGILLILILYRAKKLDVMTLGDELAIGLGVDPSKEMKIFLILAAALAATATSVAGNIAFLGLLGPHIGRKLVGPKHNRLIPVAAVVSSCLILLADTASRNLFSPLEIPAGITVSMIGVPYFIYLMMREK